MAHCRAMNREEMVSSIRRRVEKFREVDSSGCWLWTGALTHAGYGRLQVTEETGRSTAWGAHRASYTAYVGEIPEGLHLDHLCRVRHCVNPEHLEPVTCRENLDRAPLAPSTIRRSATACIHGHAFDEQNTYIDPKTGHRQCRTCRHEWTRAKRASHRGVAV